LCGSVGFWTGVSGVWGGGGFGRSGGAGWFVWGWMVGWSGLRCVGLPGCDCFAWCVGGVGIWGVGGCVCVVWGLLACCWVGSVLWCLGGGCYWGWGGGVFWGVLRCFVVFCPGGGLGFVWGGGVVVGGAGVWSLSCRSNVWAGLYPAGARASRPLGRGHGLGMTSKGATSSRNPIRESCEVPTLSTSRIPSLTKHDGRVMALLDSPIAYGDTIFCDDIRHEVGGKASYIGIYRTNLYINGSFLSPYLFLVLA